MTIELTTPSLPRDQEAFMALRAQLALHRYQLHRTNAADGEVVYFVERDGMIRKAQSMSEI
jgi:hypothetical protein